jgi:hypothetical protein
MQCKASPALDLLEGGRHYGGNENRYGARKKFGTPIMYCGPCPALLLVL